MKKNAFHLMPDCCFQRSGSYFLILIVLVFLFATCKNSSSEYKAKVQDPESLHRSMKEITDRIVHDIFSPPVASRIYAYAALAGYEAIIHQDKNYQSMAGQLKGLKRFPQPDTTMNYSFPVAAAEAVLKVGRTLIFSEDELDKFYALEMERFKKTDVPSDVMQRSVSFGDSVAKHVLAWASKDNYKQSRTFPKYSIERDPGTWQPTPPAYMDAVEPHWNMIRTFVIDSAQQFKTQRPPVFSKDKDSDLYKMAFFVYETGKNLSQEQRNMANFWDCNPFVMNVRGHVMFATKKISPGGHWINITRLACENSHANIVKSAEAYLRVAFSLADAFIVCWDEKYRSKLIRPETYINQYIDENWVPLLQTPPFPEYTSGHSVISASAAIALTQLFGDNFSYTDSTEVEYGIPPRKFGSFIQASREAAVSRLYGGIHYLPACEIGKTVGSQVGEFVNGKLITNKKNRQ
jgi:hypothetical protein